MMYVNIKIVVQVLSVFTHLAVFLRGIFLFEYIFYIYIAIVKEFDTY